MTIILTAAVSTTTAAPGSAAGAAKKTQTRTAINLHDTELMKLFSKEAKHNWQMAIQKEEEWKLLPPTTKNSHVLVDFFKDCAGQF
jgi:hypothetical protein